MRSSDKAPAAVLLGSVLVAIAVGIWSTPQSTAPRCDQVDPGSTPAHRLAPSYVPDRFAPGGVYRIWGVELWFHHVESAGSPDESTWFSVYGSAPDAGLWEFRFGDDVEAGPDAERATLHHDPRSGLSVLLWREGSAWAAVEYIGLPEAEARAIAASVRQLEPGDWEALRRSAAFRDDLIECAVVGEDVWYRRATVQMARDGRVTTADEWVAIKGASSELRLWLTTTDAASSAPDGDLELGWDFALEQHGDGVRMLVATSTPIEAATVHVVDGDGGPAAKEVDLVALPDRWCGPQHCALLVIDGVTDWAAADGTVSDHGTLTVRIVRPPSA